VTAEELDSFIRESAPLGPVVGCAQLVAHQSADIMSTWQRWEKLTGKDNQDPPFWAVVWPAGAVLANWLLTHAERVRGRRVLELGCGGGLAGIAAARAGAEVTLNDVDPVALHVAELNAAANGVKLVTERRDRIASGAFSDLDVVIAADILYHRPTAERALTALHAAAARGADVLLADAGRPFAPAPDPERIELVHTERVPVPADLEGVAVRTVRLLHIAPLRRGD
jgi:predicted nicotinamide N-methyase